MLLASNARYAASGPKEQAADGSLFPTGSGFNPTLTIVALASRVAAGIAWLRHA